MTRTLQDQILSRQIVCKDFVSAVQLVNLIMPLAEQADHHPDILIHGYNHVTITLTTHDQNAVTEKDYSLAHAIDALPIDSLLR